MTKLSRPYSSGIDAAILSGLEIVSSDGHKCWLWYMEPAVGIVDSVVIAGHTLVGKAKTLGNRYTNGITDHVHLRIHDRHGSKIDPSTVIV